FAEFGKHLRPVFQGRPQSVASVAQERIRPAALGRNYRARISRRRLLTGSLRMPPAANSAPRSLGRQANGGPLAPASYRGSSRVSGARLASRPSRRKATSTRSFADACTRANVRLRETSET